jgi:hypothetical protein
MVVVVKSRFSGAPRKRFSWSYSKLKNFETCPKRHFHADIKKDFIDEIGDNLIEGNLAHDALAKSIKEGGAPLPERFAPYQKWVERIVTNQGKPNYSVSILVEQKLAIAKDFSPCEFFDGAAWFRGVVDVAKITSILDISRGEYRAVALLGDWKTGKILEDSVQLALFAQLAFSHHSHIEKIRTEFIWLKSDCTTREDFTRADMPELWAALTPRIKALEDAHNAQEYPATPNGLCKHYCPVKICAHYGGGR